MASINSNNLNLYHTGAHATPNTSGNQQLVGIVSSVPMPRTGTPTMANGTPVLYDPRGGQLNLGGSSSQGYTVQPTVIPGSLADTTGGGAVGGGGIVVGGGTTPPNGAQPPAPGSAAANAAAATATPTASPSAAATGAATGAASVTIGADASGAPSSLPAEGTSVVMTVSGNAGTNKVQSPGAGVAANAGNGAPMATAVSVSGFGNADRGSKMVAKVGGDATFSFPSFNSTKKSTAAPTITWGEGWKRVDKGDGFFYMEHANGSKAVPAVEWRMTPSPLSAAKTIKVAGGWGKKLPDGTVIVFDKKQGPYRLAPDGSKHKLEPGTHTFGKVKIRVFEASVVRVLEKNGAVSVFDSRGNHGAGSPRSVSTAGPSSASGGGKMVSGGGDAPVKAGGAAKTDAEMAAEIAKITESARGLLQQVQGGKIDTGALASLQTQLNSLPDGIRQSIGGAGVITGDAASLGPVANATGGGGAAAPTPGATTEPSTERAAAGRSVQVDGAGSHAGTRRFAQLPEDVQASIATAFGSELGTAAFEPDTKFTITADGKVALDAGATVYKRRESQVTGGGPGDDLAMTMKPVRQARWTGGGAQEEPATHASAAHAHGDTPTSAPGSLVSGGGAAHAHTADSATRTTLFGSGDSITVPAIATATGGTFPWAKLPENVRKEILAYLKASVSSIAGSSFAQRQDDGWELDPNATIVLGGGRVTFPNGIAMVRTAASTPSTPVPPAGGDHQHAAPTDTPEGHDATRPPGASETDDIGVAPPPPPGL